MRILTVDDSKISRTVIRKELEAGGVTVFEAASGREALEQILVVRPHLVTLDVNMPGMSGFETCRAIREAGITAPNGELIPVVFITTDDTMEGRVLGFQSGATDFITKPFFKGALRKMVQHLLAPDQVFEGLKALLVEESPTLQRIIAEPLRSLGMEVEFAPDGTSAYERVCANRNGYQLMVIDYIMPGMNGDELCRRLRQELGLQDLPIVLMSALEDERTILEGFRAGASDFIPKPYVKEVFLARISRLLAQSMLNEERRGRLETMERFTFYQDALARFTSSEFNSPLANILACADRVREHGIDPGEYSNLASSIRESSAYLMQLVSEMETLNQFYAGSRPPTAEGESQGEPGGNVIPFPKVG